MFNKKRNKLKGVSILITIIVVLASPFIIWKFKNTTLINAIILDKTVPRDEYREHKGLVWILNNLKYYNKSNGKAFSYSEDYYGFHPLSNEKFQIKQLDENIKDVDLIYIADTYGVYEDDFYNSNYRGERSKLIYGGTQKDELKIIEKNLNNNILIGEFNSLSSPTNIGEKGEMERIFALQWTGWIGRYFESLSRDNEEIPIWLVKEYELENLKRWDLTGEGIVLLNQNKIVVLRPGKELNKNFNKIVFTEKALKEFKVKDNVSYNYWFEIVNADKDAEVVANYNIDVTMEGKDILKKLNLQPEFPAIIRQNKSYTTYYFAGDFADNNRIPSKWNAVGMDYFNKITTIESKSNQDYFFWNVYYPLMKKILKEIK